MNIESCKRNTAVIHTLSKIISIISITLIASLCLLSCSSDNSNKSASTPARLVKTITVHTTDANLSRTIPGKVYANQKVDLAFEVKGTIIELPIREGLQVRKGDLIARLDPRDYEINVSYAQAKYDNAASMLSRVKQLLDKGHISEADYDKKKMEKDVSKADLDKAKKELSDTSLYAPFDGVIAKQYVDNHQYVEAKLKIVSLQDSTDIEVQLDISEQDVTLTGGINKLSAFVTSKETIGYVSFPAVSNKEYPVRLKEFATEANPKTQTFLFKVALEHPKDVNVLPGMTALTKFIKANNGAPVIVIPFSAVCINPKGNYYVWIIDPKTQLAKKQAVSVGAIENDTIKILSGLSDNDVVVIAGTSQVAEGMKLKSINSNNKQ